MSLNRWAGLYDTAIGTYTYEELLWLYDYNSSIEEEETFKYPLDTVRIRKNNEGI
jgi:hypothetical protein